MKELRCDYLKNNDISIKNGFDVNAVMRDMMSVLLEGVPDQDLNEELGYSSWLNWKAIIRNDKVY